MKIFAIPDLNKVTGQSEISRIVKKTIKPEGVIYLNRGVIYFFFRLFKYFNTNPDYLYITLSRSKLGSFRDYLIIFFLKPKKILSHIHGFGFINNYFFLNRNLLRSTVIILLTEESKKIFRETHLKYNGELMVIENPILEDSNINETHISNIEDLNVCYFSNLLNEKGINEFITLSEIYRDKYNFNIAGRNIDNISIPENVNYSGVLKGKAKNNFIIDNHILVFYSYYKEEFYPVALIEFIYHGKMCIVKKHNSLEKTFKNLNIYWVDTYQDIIKLLSDKTLLINRLYDHNLWYNKNIDLVKERFSRLNFDNKIKQIFEK